MPAEWEQIISKRNLELAWRRIGTSRNLQYKRFFREAYLVYESSLAANLAQLHSELKTNAWSPTNATRIHLPKPSGLQRPLSLLEIEDQILLQAVTNVFANQLRSKRATVELKVVYSNLQSDEKKSIFFNKPWQYGYRKYQTQCVKAFNDGFRWAADFDLAAYYDTISHDLLLNIVDPRNVRPELKSRVMRWLQTWTANNPGAETGHGIPQGPASSDFLAELFFLPIDKRMQAADFRYLRYVDDIRLYGKTENEIRRAAIQLEQECRHRGLIPQSSKFVVREVKSRSEAMGALPSISAPKNLPISRYVRDRGAQHSGKIT